MSHNSNFSHHLQNRRTNLSQAVRAILFVATVVILGVFHVNAFAHGSEAQSGWIKVAEIFPPENSSFYHQPAAISEGRVVISGRVECDNPLPCETIFLIEKLNGEWKITDTLFGDPISGGDIRKSFIGDIEINGNTIVASGIASGHYPLCGVWGATVLISCGRVFVLEYVNGEWIETTELAPPPQILRRSLYGINVAFDGNVIAVAEPHSTNGCDATMTTVDDPSQQTYQCGAVYRYERREHGWQLIEIHQTELDDHTYFPWSRVSPYRRNLIAVQDGIIYASNVVPMKRSKIDGSWVYECREVDKSECEQIAVFDEGKASVNRIARYQDVVAENGLIASFPSDKWSEICTGPSRSSRCNTWTIHSAQGVTLNRLFDVQIDTGEEHHDIAMTEDTVIVTNNIECEEYTSGCPVLWFFDRRTGWSKSQTIFLQRSLFPTTEFMIDADENVLVVQSKRRGAPMQIYERRGCIQAGQECVSLSFFDPDPGVVNYVNSQPSPRDLSNRQREVRSVAADGATRVLLRADVYEPGEAEFCLGDGADGAISTDAISVNGARCVSTSSTTVSGEELAFAFYHVPENFTRNGDDTTRASRNINIEITFTPQDPDLQVTSVTETLELRRPPLLLVHGYNSGPATWEGSPLLTDDRFSVARVDYSRTSTNRFAVNDLVVERGIDKLRLMYPDLLFVRVDYIGHSMGGMLGRRFANEPDYRSSDTYNEGHFNRFITLNTPHAGASTANLLWSLRDNKLALITLDEYFDINGGAIFDLRVGSDAVQNMGATEVRGHAVGGAIGGDVDDLPIILRATRQHFYFRALMTVGEFLELTIYEDTDHDLVVGYTSQIGGLSGEAETIVTGADAIHTNVTSTQQHYNILVDLLNATPSGTRFASFPPASTVLSNQRQIDMQSSAMAFDQQVTAMTTAPETLSLSGITDNQVLLTGDTVTLAVDTQSAGQPVTEVLLVTPTTVEIDNTPPFEFTVTMPDDYVGSFSVVAYGKDTGAVNFVSSSEITASVVANDTLMALNPLETDLFFSTIGQNSQIMVDGVYSDNIIRRLPSNWVTYTSADETVVTVDEAGLMTAVGAGETTVTISLGDVSTTVAARVVLANVPPVADAGPYQTRGRGAEVTLDGSASNDPDDAPTPLTYEWTQVAGEDVTLSDPTSATPAFTTETLGDYEFALVVFDGEVYSSSATVTVTIEPSVDVNGDGFVTPADSIFVINRIGQDPVVDTVADVDGDGDIDEDDANLVLTAIGQTVE